MDKRTSNSSSSSSRQQLLDRSESITSSNSNSLSTSTTTMTITVNNQQVDPSLPQPDSSFFVQALYPFNGASTASLSFRKGDIIEVLTQLSSGWWDGVIWRQRERGWFPSNYVCRITDQEAQIARARLDASLQEGASPETGNYDKIYTHNTSSSLSNSVSVTAGVWESNSSKDLNHQASDIDPTQEVTEKIHRKRPSRIDSIPSKDPSSSSSLSSLRPEHSHNRSNSSVNRYRVLDKSSGWVDWIPKVNEDGQIYYYNTTTGEMASEMPSADDELDLDNCSNPPRVDRPAPTSVMAPSTGGAAAVAVSSVEKIDEDPLKFLENHGFTSEQLYHHGIISLRADDRSISSRNMPLNLIDKLSSEMIQHPAPSSTVSGGVSDASLGIRGSVPETFAIAPPTSSDVATAPSSSVPEAVNRRKLSSVVGPEYGNVSDVSHWSSDQNTSSDVAGSMFDLHQRRTSNSTVPTTAKSFQSFSLPDVVYVSDQIISNLRTGLEIPPTLTFPRMAMEVHEAISALAQLTAPSTQDSKDSEYLDPRLTEKAGEMTQNARDQISEASIRLVDRIRYMLQSSCQLDTGVISMLNESSTATSFMSPSFKFQRLSTNSSSTDSSMGLVSHSRSGSLNGSFSGQTNSAYPDLKHSTRKIASTLSKLTLSTRALWGMFSTLLLEVPPRADGRERSDDYDDNDDSRLQVEANRRYNAQTRFTLEQKLRSECKVGVGDLTTNVDNFIHQFDKILRERVSSQLDPSPLLHFPRHGRGYLSVPIQYTFLPGGAKGGNWKSSGFDKLLSPTPHSSSSEYGTGPMGGKNSPRSSMGNLRSNKLTLEWFSKRLFPSIRKVIDSSRFIFGALSQGNGNEFGDDATVYVGFVSPTTVKPPGRLDENTSDALLVEVLDLIDLSGSILSAAESLDIASSLEIDLDPYILHDLNHNAQTKDSTMQETLALVTNQLRSARYLVAEFQRSKQKLYEVNAKLIMTTQMLLTSGGSFLTPTTNSPAQQPFASPLFSHNPPTIPNEGTQKILQVLELFYSSFESFGSATQSLAQEAERQSAQELSLSSFNQTVRTGISLRKFGSGSNDLGILNLYRNKGEQRDSAQSALNQQRVYETSNGKISADRRSPHPPGHGYGKTNYSDRDQADPEGRASLTNNSLWSHSASSTAESEKTQEARNVAAGQASEVPFVVSDTANRVEQNTSHSPTRSKKLAKFFGEEAASQIIPPNKAAPSSSSSSTSSRPSFLMPDYGPEDISFNVDNQVRGGTLKGLVIKLTSHEGPDVAFLRVFLMTYRTFTTSHDFLDMLIERYHQVPPPNLTPEELKVWTDQKQKVIKIRVINVIRSWVESHLSDEDSEGVIQRVTEFSVREMGDSNLAKQITSTCERRQSRSGSIKLTPVNPPGNPPPSILPRSTRKIKFLDIDPLELARQLTLIESNLFRQIQTNECLGKAWPKEFAKEGTPNIKAMIDMSNALTRWVSETILLQPEQKKRASTIKHFILIAERCRSLSNFSTLMQIVAGLNSTPIYRLRRTWETIPQKILTLFSGLNNMMSPTKNYADYREAIRNLAPPCVPFIGVYLTDWTFIGDGNPDNLREKPHQINFNKRQKAADLIVQIQLYQSMPYQLTSVPRIVKFLESTLNFPREEKELYEMSLDIEPRERDDEKIARLLAESGFL